VASRRRITLDIMLWVFALFLAWVFARQGISKFSDDSGWARAFRVWHFPDWFRVCVGVAETFAAAMLLTRRTAFGGAAIIIAVMLGAMATHIYWGQPGQVRSEILPLVLATLVAIGRRKSFILIQRNGTVERSDEPGATGGAHPRSGRTPA
jgi:putative oxidoreductase